MSKQSSVEFAPTGPNYGRAFEKLYLACLWASPGEDVKRGFKELQNELMRQWYAPGQNETVEKEALRVLAGRLYDGLSYGNWPRA